MHFHKNAYSIVWKTLIVVYVHVMHKALVLYMCIVCSIKLVHTCVHISQFHSIVCVYVRMCVLQRFFVQGLTEHPVKSVVDCVKCLVKGSREYLLANYMYLMCTYMSGFHLQKIITK